MQIPGFSTHFPDLCSDHPNTAESRLVSFEYKYLLAIITTAYLSSYLPLNVKKISTYRPRAFEMIGIVITSVFCTILFLNNPKNDFDHPWLDPLVPESDGFWNKELLSADNDKEEQLDLEYLD